MYDFSLKLKKNQRDLEEMLYLLTPTMTKVEFLLKILFNFKQKSEENKWTFKSA